MKRGGGVIRLFATHPTAANLLMLAMLLVGWGALQKLNTQFFPTFSLDIIQVEVEWPGASAEDVDNNIIQAIEPELRFLDGIDSVFARAYEGVAVVYMEYEQGADMQSALAQAEAAVGQVTTLPESAETPEVQRIFPYETVGRILISGPLSQEALQAFARRIRADLLSRGVDRVGLIGMRTPEIWIEPAPETLRRLDLTLADVADAVSASSEDSPLGDLAGGDRRFRALGQSRTPEDFAKIAVRAFPDGRKITVGDIATVRAAWEEGGYALHRADAPAIELHVQRSTNADALKVQQVVLDYLDEITPTLPPTLAVEPYDMAADLVRQRIDLLLENALGGLILVVGVLFLFLHARVAFWVAAGIPVALAATLGVMLAFDQSINMISLFGLIMALGIIVDDAIVVGEHAEALHAQGADATTAAVGGAERMAAPVFSASLTSICAFLPLLVIGGIIGSIVAAIPMVIVCVLIASLIECFLILPGHMRLAFAKPLSKSGWTGRFRDRFDRRFDAFRNGRFRRSVIWAMANRYSVVAGAFAMLMLAAGLIAGGRVGFVFFPTPEGDTAFANVEMIAGTPQTDTIAMLEEMQRALDATEAAIDSPEGPLVEMAVTIIGATIDEDGINADSGTDTVGSMRLQLRTADARGVRMDDFIARWRAEIEPRAGLESLNIRAPTGGPPGRDVDVRLNDGAPETLKAAAEEVKAILRGYPGVKEIEDDLPYGKPETILELTPRGRSLGFELRDVSTQLRGALEGEIAERFPRGDEEVTVRVRQPADALNVAALSQLFLRTPDGAETPLSEVVDQSERAGFNQIRRTSGLREVAVLADVDPAQTNTGEVLERLEADGIAEIAKKYGVGYEFRGKAEEEEETFADMQLGAVLGLAGIYIILAWVFGSYTRPLAVVAIIPLGFIGAVFGHLIMGYDLTILSIIGVIGLSGIVVNDSIVLVTTIDGRMKTQAPMDAVIGGACDRLRAVLLTSLTTIGGLTPLLFETSLQAQFLIPMALTFVFGLMGATLLILYVGPAITLIQHDVGWGFSRLRRAMKTVSPPAAAGE